MLRLNFIFISHLDCDWNSSRRRRMPKDWSTKNGRQHNWDHGMNNFGLQTNGRNVNDNDFLRRRRCNSLCKLNGFWVVRPLQLPTCACRNNCDEMRPILQQKLLRDSKTSQLMQMADNERLRQTQRDQERMWWEVASRSNYDQVWKCNHTIQLSCWL